MGSGEGGRERGGGKRLRDEGREGRPEGERWAMVREASKRQRGRKQEACGGSS